MTQDDLNLGLASLNDYWLELLFGKWECVGRIHFRWPWPSHADWCLILDKAESWDPTIEKSGVFFKMRSGQRWYRDDIKKMIATWSMIILLCKTQYPFRSVQKIDVKRWYNRMWILVKCMTMRKILQVYTLEWILRH